jgi:hypothetical protein
LCCLWGIIFEGSKFQFRKNSVGPTRQCQKPTQKKITVACPTDKGDPGRLTTVANKCYIMPLDGIRPVDGGTQNIVANKCSIVRNAPCRMYMHPRRRPDPWTLLLPRSDLHHRRQPVLPCCRTHVTLHNLSGGAHARSRVQGCHSSRNHSIGLDPVSELSGFPLVPCPDCGMAWVVEGWTQKEGENHCHLYLKCARSSVSSLLCLPNPS